MNKLTEEEINLKFVTFIKVLKKYGLYTEKFAADNDFNQKLKLAPFHHIGNSGGAYDGGLIRNTMSITKYAKQLNEILPESEKIEEAKLLKVCFLHQLGKVRQYISNTVDYEIKNGKFYKFDSNLPALKMGELSVLVCNQFDIVLTEEEYTAILSTSKRDDTQNESFGSTLSKILAMANDMAEIERKSILNK